MDNFNYLNSKVLFFDKIKRHFIVCLVIESEKLIYNVMNKI